MEAVKGIYREIDEKVTESVDFSDVYDHMSENLYSGTSVYTTQAYFDDARDLMANLAQFANMGGAVSGHAGKSLRTHGGKVHRSRHGAQRLVGADVTAGLLPADVLFPGGQGEDVAPPPLPVVGLSHDPAGELAGHGLGGGHKAQIGPAPGELQPQGLPLPHRHVRAAGGGGLHHGAGDGVDPHDELGARGVGDLPRRRGVLHISVVVGLLEVDTGALLVQKALQRLQIGAALPLGDQLHLGARPEAVGADGLDHLGVGTGGHETTYMIVSELLDNDINGLQVLDCGCGTGILSIVSAKLGAKNVTGYDIDEWSTENTKHNCIINGITNVSILHGNANVINTLETEFDIVLANINRNILLNDMPQFKHAMRDGAKLILSGFYEKDAEMLINKAEELKLKLDKKKTKNDWCMLVFK